MLTDVNSVKDKLAENYGTKEDDKKLKAGEAYPQMTEFMDKIDCINFYVFATLLLERQGLNAFKRWRFLAKVMFLPIIQVVVPILIMQASYGTEDDDGYEIGICPNDPSTFHRFIGLAFMIYSVWGTIDGMMDGASTAIIEESCKYYKLTGIRPDWKFMVGYIVHVVISIVCLFTLYLTMAASTSVMSLCYNCFGITFLLGIDDEWVSGPQSERAMQMITMKFRFWRDIHQRQPKVLEDSVGKDIQIRRRIVDAFRNFHKLSLYLVSFTGYSLALFFFGCDAAW